MRTTRIYAAAVFSIAFLFAGEARTEVARGMVVGARVMPHVRSRITEQPATLQITREDVGRGYLEVPAARMWVQTNDPAGFLVVAAVEGEIFEGAELIGFDEKVLLGAGGGFLHRAFNGTSSTEHVLRCRFRVAPGTAPGVYRWPLHLTVRELAPRGV